MNLLRVAIAATRARLRGSPVARLVALGVLSRVFVIAVAWVAGATLPSALEDGWNSGTLFLRYFARWDSGFYLAIASQGYGFKPEAWAFSPGYPAAIALVHAVVPFVGYTFAGFLVSNAAFFASLVLLYRLTSALFDERFAWRAAAVFAFFPSAFYASAVYAEALFLAAALGTFLLAHRGRWLTAGALASLAAVTRPTGLVLLGALGLAVLLALHRDRRLPWTGFAAMPVAAALPAAFALYSWGKTGDAFIGIHAREAFWPTVRWHSPLMILDFSGSPPVITAHVYAYLAFLAAVVGWVVFDLARRGRVAALPVYAFTLVLAAVYFLYGDVVPIVRYLLPVVPAYWMVADVARSRSVLAGTLVVLAILTGVVAAVFATWGSLY